MDLTVQSAQERFRKFAWGEGVKNWLGGFLGGGGQQNVQQIAQQLNTALAAFKKLTQSQLQIAAPALKSIGEVISGLASQQGAQALQMQPGMANQVNELISTLQQAVQEENQDSQFIGQIAQRAQGIAQSFGQQPAQSTQPTQPAQPYAVQPAQPVQGYPPRRASVTAGMGASEHIFKH